MSYADNILPFSDFWRCVPISMSGSSWYWSSWPIEIMSKWYILDLPSLGWPIASGFICY